MAPKLNGYVPPLATVITIAVLVIGVAVSWGSSATRLDEHDRRMDETNRRVIILEKLVGDMRADVAAILRAVE